MYISNFRPGTGDREILTSSSLTNSYQACHQFPTLLLVNVTFPLCLWLFYKCWHSVMEYFLHLFCYLLLALTLRVRHTLVLFIWHLPSCFIPVDGLFPLFIPAAQRGKKAWGLLAIVYQPTNQPVSFFSHWTQSLLRFSFLNIPLEPAWEKPCTRK